MNVFQFTYQARLDLLKIVEDLGEHKKTTSALVRSIEERCRLIAEFPESGKSREELSPGLRSVVVDSYLIFYRNPDDLVQIVRILHGRRDLGSIFREITE
jgi:toxin ParE1/3/4